MFAATLPAQSDQHGWTQAANKTRIRRVSTHTGLQRKSSRTRPIPPCSLHKLLFIILLGLSFLPSFPRFHPLRCAYPPSPQPVSSPHKGASRNYSFCWASSENSQCLLPTAPFTLWILSSFFFVAVPIMKRAVRAFADDGRIYLHFHTYRLLHDSSPTS